MSHCEFLGLALKELGEEGIRLCFNSTENLIQGCTITDAGLWIPGWGEGIYIGTSQGERDGTVAFGMHMVLAGAGPSSEVQPAGQDRAARCSLRLRTRQARRQRATPAACLPPPSPLAPALSRAGASPSALSYLLVTHTMGRLFAGQWVTQDRSSRNRIVGNRVGPGVAAECIDLKEGCEETLVEANFCDGRGLSGANYACECRTSQRLIGGML